MSPAAIPIKPAFTTTPSDDPVAVRPRTQWMGDAPSAVTRRLFLACFSAIACTPAIAANRPVRALRFEAFRNGQRVGAQAMTFETAPGALTVRTVADFAVKLGPITIFSYHHEAVEQWQDGAFAGIRTRTNQNGRLASVSAVRRADCVLIAPSPGRTITVPAAALPFTHWNRKIASAPLFNPQDGRLLHEHVSNAGLATIRLADGSAVLASRIGFRGDASIDDYYGRDGAWVGLVGHLADGSVIEYRLSQGPARP